MFKGVSTNGSSPIQVQLGTSSGATTSGYGGSVQGPFDNSPGAATHSSGFRISNPNASGNVHEGIMTITNITGNNWVEGSLISGRKALLPDSDQEAFHYLAPSTAFVSPLSTAPIPLMPVQSTSCTRADHGTH